MPRKTGKPRKLNEKQEKAKLIVDLLIKRDANKRKLKLSDDYWNDPVWKQKYKITIIAVNRCIKLYSFEAIINALKRKECLWATSISHHLYPFFKEEQNKLQAISDLVEKAETNQINQNTVFNVYKKTGGESKRNKLRD